MPAYLLPCNCGKSVRIEPRQAGDQVDCECGARLDVPALRQMQLLAVAEDVVEPVSSGWGFGQGVLTAGLLVAAICAGIGTWFWRAEPQPLQPFSAEVRGSIVERDVEKWTPSNAYDIWRIEYQPVLRRGRLDPFIDPREAEIERRITVYRIGRWTFFGLAAVVGLGSVALASSSWGDRGTGRDSATGVPSGTPS